MTLDRLPPATSSAGDTDDDSYAVWKLDLKSPNLLVPLDGVGGTFGAITRWCGSAATSSAGERSSRWAPRRSTSTGSCPSTPLRTIRSPRRRCSRGNGRRRSSGDGPPTSAIPGWAQAVRHGREARAHPARQLPAQLHPDRRPRDVRLWNFDPAPHARRARADPIPSASTRTRAQGSFRDIQRGHELLPLQRLRARSRGGDREVPRCGASIRRRSSRWRIPPCSRARGATSTRHTGSCRSATTCSTGARRRARTGSGASTRRAPTRSPGRCARGTLPAGARCRPRR